MTAGDENGSPKMTRRGVLRAMGAGAAGLAATGGVAGGAVAGLAGQGTAHAAPPATQSAPLGRFGRMFRLRPFSNASPRVIEALNDIGKPGGILDAKDDMSKGPVELIIDLDLSLNNPNHPTTTAGTTFVGQLIDHDITLDLTSRLGKPQAPESAVNSRTPALDLESVYGGGPIASSHLYDPYDRPKLRYDQGDRFEDLPRDANGAAIIGDPRNDQNLMLAGLVCAVMLFHNRAVDLVRAQGVTDPADVFAAARRLTTWHFQWIALHEFLPAVLGQARTTQILTQGRSFYRPTSPFIPVEFQGAAFRMGHSMVRPSYRANLGRAGHPAFFGMIFDPALEFGTDRDDLLGGFRAARRFIGWQTFFDFGDGEVRPNKRIDTHLSTPLFNLPIFTIPTSDAPSVLPQRTLMRHVTWMLPSGQDIARAMGAPVLPAADLSELQPYGLRFESSTPLWYYILKEAEVMEDGLQLGPVGGTIVGEVLIGLIELDPDSVLNQPGWRPTLPQRDGAVTGEFEMTDFLTFAGVDPTTRGE